MADEKQTTAVCQCVACSECEGRGTVWFTFGHQTYLGPRRCDDLDEMESCEECGGSGVTDICSGCQGKWEDFNDDNQP